MGFCRKTGIAALFIFLGLALAACGKSATLTELLDKKGFSKQSVGGMRVELRYLKESKGSNYIFADLSGKGDILGSLFDCLAASAPAKKPEAAQYSPEVLSDCELLITDGNGDSCSLYYIAQDKLIVYPQMTKGKDGETLEYQYFATDEALGNLMQGQRQHAKLTRENKTKPFRNMEELKASIDSEELMEEGTELDFEFFTEKVPDNAGTACMIYTSANFAALPEDSVLITAYGKSKTGEQQKLNILGVEANSYYTKIIVAEPDEALESVETGDDTPEAFAATMKKSALDTTKWIVFVDDGNSILDVIVTDEIDGIKEGGSQTPTGTAEPGPGTSAEVGSGDE